MTRLSGRDGLGDPVPSALEIVLDLDTEMVVINVAEEMKIEADGAINVVDGEPHAVVLNLHSEKPKLTLKSGAQVVPVLLMPNKPVKAPKFTYLSNVYSAAKMSLSGAIVEDVLLCEQP